VVKAGVVRPTRGWEWLARYLKAFEAYYWAPGGPAGKTQSDVKRLGAGGWRGALEVFFADYAFERAGAPRIWPSIAREIVSRFPAKKSLRSLPEWAWNEFEMCVTKPNPTSNPLNSRGGKEPATRFIANLNADRNNLISWAARLTSNGDATLAYRKLQTLQGIGPKIAALFLRDVVTSYGIRESALDDRRCILPVDTWVRRGMATIVGNEDLMKETRDPTTQVLAIEWADAHGIRVAALDAGLWVLGARLARSLPVLASALENRSSFERFIDEELERTEAVLVTLRGIAGATRTSSHPKPAEGS
jgi:hypothetical protein